MCVYTYVYTVGYIYLPIWNVFIFQILNTIFPNSITPIFPSASEMYRDVRISPRNEAINEQRIEAARFVVPQMIRVSEK